jgi:hypothetical protein
MKTRSLKSSRLQQQAKQRRGEQTDRIRIARISHLSFSIFVLSFCLCSLPLSFYQSLNVSAGRQTAAGQGITDDEEIGKVVCYGVKALIWWKEKSSTMCVILSLAVSPRQQDDNACQFPRSSSIG